MRRQSLLGLIAYSAMIGLVVQGFLLIQKRGERWFDEVALREPVAPTPGTHTALLHLLIALITIVLAARLLGVAAGYLRQPPVIGEVLAGILLGPSLLGTISPAAYAFLLPQAVASHLGTLAQLGIILYMFLVGVELDAASLRRKSHATAAISHASIGLPFLLGALSALWLYREFAPPGSPFGIFALFLGVSMSVTAFPVLARILTDRGLQRAPLGVVALGCAAVDDVTAWCLLALLVGVSRSSHAGVAIAIGGTALFAAVILVAGRPWMRAVVRAQELRQRVGTRALASVLIALLACALVTESVGIHAVFGAFMLGVIVPHDSLLASELKRKLETIVLLLLLPAFFALTGMRTKLSLVSGASAWLACFAIVLIASVGKVVGTLVAARIVGMNWRDSASLGVLMNTRGLMELIVLNIGLELGVISPTLFAMLVIMAVVTTLATAPLLTLLQRSAQVDSRALARST